MIKFRMKEAGPVIEDEILISEVKKHSFLYDIRSNDYRNLPLRAVVWSSIAKILNIDDQNVIQKRWKVLREKFSLSYRREVIDEVTSNWPLYESLRFLEPFVNLKPDSKKFKSDESYDGENKSNAVSKSPLDELFLVQLVRQRPVLFDKKHEDFRVPSARKKAWEEISDTINWDIETLQKRWRVMRDRFVRELRKTKNIDSDLQLNCTTFFREMLFLTHHVRSKKYEVEAHLDLSEDSREFELEDCNGSKVLTAKSSENEPADEEHFTTHYIDDETDNSLKFDEDERVLEEHIEIHDDEYIEEVVECSQNEEVTRVDNSEIITVEEVSDTWTQQRPIENKVHPQKRPFPSVYDEFQQTSNKVARHEESAQYTVINARETTENDEDLIFGNTLGCMLKRIPQHLKTAVKLKLLQSLAEFEAEHKI